MKTGRAKLGRAVAAAAVAVAIPLVALTLVAVLGVPISAGPWRERIAATASEALGRPVALDGPLELVLGWRTALHVGGIRIANPPGFATPDFASLGDARAEVDLVRALQGRLRIRSLEAANARVRLERGADGRGNWTFDALTPTGEAPDADDDDLPDVSVRINRVKLRDIAVEHHDARTSRTRYFDLDQLDAEAVRGQAFKATARGRVEKQFPWVLEVDGAPARALYRGEPWPFELTFEFVGTRLYAAGSANPRGDEADVNFGLGTANLAGVERLLQTELPKVGVTSIAARLTVREGSVALSDIRGVVGASELTGEIALATGGERPKVTGDLAVATFDLRPFLDDPTPADDKPLAYAGRENQTLRLPGLAAADADAGWGSPATSAMRPSTSASMTGASSHRSKQPWARYRWQASSSSTPSPRRRGSSSRSARSGRRSGASPRCSPASPASTARSAALRSTSAAAATRWAPSCAIST